MQNCSAKPEEKPKNTFQGHRPTKSTFGSAIDKKIRTQQMLSNSDSSSNSY